MATFKVSEVIDGDTFKVSGGWKWKGETGDTVRAKGYDTPEKGKKGYQAAKDKLRELILGKQVELKNPATFTYGRLLCDVYAGGKKLASYFKQYQQRAYVMQGRILKGAGYPSATRPFINLSSYLSLWSGQRFLSYQHRLARLKQRGLLIRRREATLQRFGGGGVHCVRRAGKPRSEPRSQEWEAVAGYKPKIIRPSPSTCPP